MPLTERALNRATLARQGLLTRQEQSPALGVRRALAIQAQDPMSPYLALWNRVDRFDPVDLDRAFRSCEIVKAPLMRITLHAVERDEYPMLHAAMMPTLRAARLNDRRFEEAGIAVDEADALVAGLVEFCGSVRSKAEILDHLTGRLGREAHPRLWWALRTYAPLLHAPTGGPWSFGHQPSYVAASAPLHPHEEGLRTLVRRYLEGFGPATVGDISQYTMRRRADIREAIAALADDLVTVEGPDGVPHLDVPGVPLPAEDEPAEPRLLGMWESTLLAYEHRSRTLPERYRGNVIRQNGDVLPTVLVDGHVAGMWRFVAAGIEVQAFDRLPSEVWAALEGEAGSLIAMVGERGSTYGRYDHWWEKIGDVGISRVLEA